MLNIASGGLEPWSWTGVNWWAFWLFGWHGCLLCQQLLKLSMNFDLFFSTVWGANGSYEC